MKRIVVTLALLLLASTAGAAALLRQFDVQEVTTLRPGRYTFTFRLYTARTGGSPVFTERKTIRLTSPTLRHALGSVNRSGMARLNLARQLYLEVRRAGTTVPVVRRRPLFAVPYALYSQSAGGGAGDITAVNTAAGSGLTGGTASGNANLAVVPGPGVTVGVGGVAVSFAGSGSAGTAARSDHAHSTAGTRNTALGEGAYPGGTASGITAIGYHALNSNTSGFANTAVGEFTLANNLTGSGNTALGKSALEANLTGTGNTAVGQALGWNTAGNDNSALGSGALARNQTGNSNTAVGTSALFENRSGNSNTALGYQAGDLNTVGSSNTLLGAGADTSANNLTNATAVGANALVGASNSLVLGSGANVGIGIASPTHKLHVEGGDVLFAGKLSFGTATRQMLDLYGTSYGIGIQNNVMYLRSGFDFYWYKGGTHSDTQGDPGTGGTALMALTSNGNLNITGTNAYKPGGGTWTDSSDLRLKRNVRPLDGALEQLLRLRGVEYEWVEPQHAALFPGYQRGMIAQEVEPVFPEWVGTDEKGYRTLTFRGFEALTVEALRTLEAENAALRVQAAEQRERLDAQEAAIAELRRQMVAQGLLIERLLAASGRSGEVTASTR